MRINEHISGRLSKLATAGLAVLLTCFISNAFAAGTVRLYLADGFDFPVGKPDSVGYYKARGYMPNGHHGEDWNGKGGGNTDLGDPVYSCGDGIVVQSKDCRKGWGNVVIIRHVYREKDGSIKTIDSLYGHLDRRYVTLHQRVKRGQRIGTIGTNRGMYLAHLHFEIRKNIYIGMHRSKFKRGYGNWWDPTYFIKTHRRCQTSSRSQQVAINTFQPYPAGSSNIASSKPPPGARIAKVEKKVIRVPVPSQRRTATKTTSSSGSTASRFKDTRSSSRTLSLETQRIVAQQKKTYPKPAKPEERKTIWSRLKKKATTAKTTEARKPIGRRRGIFRRRN